MPQATASIIPIGKRELGVDLWFYSPDENRAHRVAARLRHLASVHWEDSRDADPKAAAQRGASRLVLLDYAADAATRSSELARQFASLAPGMPLLGVGSTASDHANGVLAALRAGVRDFIDLDGSDEEIGTLLQHALHQASDAPAARRPGRLVLLLGTRPGVGTSTLAAHLGALVAADMPADAGHASRTLLLDLGYPAGDASLYLDVHGDFHYADALRNAARLDATLLRTALPKHACRLSVLSQSPGAAAPPDAAETPVLLDCLRGIFELVIADLGGVSCRQLPPELLRAADDLWLVTDQGIASAVALDGCLRELEALHARDERLALIVNRHDPDCGMAAAQLAARFDLPLLAVLPERSRALRSSANQGRLLHQRAPGDPYVKALRPLLARFRGGAATAAPWWKLLLKRTGDRRWKTR